LRVAETEGDVAAELARPRAGDREHGRTELDADQPSIGRVVRQVAAGADGDLEHIARRLPADPLAPASKEQAVEEVHFGVVPVRVLLVEREYAVRLALESAVRRGHVRARARG
jgi:hypothetical protein